MKTLIQKLLSSSILSIKHNMVFFITLIILHITIMIFVVLGSEWINNNIKIYPFHIGPIVLRISLFAFILGIWIGYFKLILAFIDNKKKTVFSICAFKYSL